jgi:proteasome lid subunit RPN8/RPN11
MARPDLRNAALNALQILHSHPVTQTDKAAAALQAALYPAAFWALLAMQEALGLSIKQIGWTAAFSAFLSYDLVSTLRRRELDKLKGGSG